MPSPSQSSTWLTGLALLFATSVPAGADPKPEPAPADLRLEWRLAPGEKEGAPVRGRESEAVALAYRLRNVGGRDAFAVLLEARTALGRAEGPVRVQPGPRAGAAVDRALRLTLAVGMREVCLEASLQTLEASEPGDPRPEDNRICRRIEIEPAREAAGPGRSAGRTREPRP